MMGIQTIRLSGFMLLVCWTALGWTQSGPVPVRPRPVENWTAPPRPAETQGSVLPDSPPVREISPLQPPKRVEGPVFGSRPIEPLPVPPVAAEGDAPDSGADSPSPAEGALVEVFQDSIHPIILAPERFLSVNGQGVALRDGPGVDYRKVGTLYQGDLVEWRDTDDHWHRVVIASGTDGWMAGEYAEAVPQRIALVTGERVNLRDAPSDQALVLGSLYLGAVVTAMETFGDWTQIRTPNLRNAYIANTHLRQLGENERPPFPFQPHPETAVRIASLARIGQSATGEVEYLLAVQPGDWVKGGKVGLVYLSNYTLPFFGEEPDPAPTFREGAYFEKVLFRDQYSSGLPSLGDWKDPTSSILAAHLRGKKEGPVWTYPFKFAPGKTDGRFALCRQKGEGAGSFLLLEVTSLEVDE